MAGPLPRPGRIGVLGALALDLRDALRALLRDRGFALTAIGMLTLALALNVAAFTLMDAMLVRGYPLVERNDRLLYIQERGALGCCVAYRNFVDWRAQATSFEGMAYVDGQTLTLRDENGGRERLSAPFVSPELFGLLGVQPVIGRDFVAEDSAAGAAPVAILSYALWQRRFGQRGDVIGETLETDDGPVTIIGVMPERFSFPEHNALWMPVPAMLAEANRTQAGFFVVARLRDGMTIAGARAELATIASRLAEAYPDTNRGVTAEAEPHADAADLRPARLRAAVARDGSVRLGARANDRGAELDRRRGAA